MGLFLATLSRMRSAPAVDRVGALRDALDPFYAIIEFTPDGTIVDANGNFLSAMGYTLDEIVGGHHRMFVDPAYAASQEYRSSGRGSGAASTSPRSSSASPRAAVASGFKRPTSR